jgi:hypothetical protein
VYSGSKKSLNVNEYASWYSKEKSTLTTKQEVNNIQYELVYVPYEFQIGHALINGDLTLDESKSMEKDYATEHTFRLSMVLPFQGKDVYSYNENSSLTKEQRILYYLNDLKNDVFLISNNGDTLSSINAMLEQGISNMNIATFLFDFNKFERSEIKELIFLDKHISEQAISFDLSIINLTQIPKLSLKGYGK